MAFDAAAVRLLIEGLQSAAARNLTEAGHVAQKVVWEHMGSCRTGQCTDVCVAINDLLDLADLYLEETRDVHPADPRH